MTQLDDNKADIVDAIESLNRLAVSVHEQQGTIDRRSRSCPSALTSLDKQRDDLVRMLQALDQPQRRRRPRDQGVQGRDHRLAAPAPPGAHRARRLRRRLREVVQRLPDLPVRRRGRRPRPAGRPQPAHGRLHQPLDRARRRPSATQPGLPTDPADVLPTEHRPDQGPRATSLELPRQRRPHQRGLPEGARHARGAAKLKEVCRKPKNSDKAVCSGSTPSRACPRPARAAGGARRSARGRSAAASRSRRPAARRLRADATPAAPTWSQRSDGPTMATADAEVYDPALVSLLVPGMVSPMITRRTKIQLLIFVVITLLGVTYVGARYARLDRLVFDDNYTVVAHFADSGGIFAGGEVTYRGVSVGRVEQARAHRRGRRRLPRHRQRLRRHPGRHAGRGRQPVRGRRAVRRAPAAGRRRRPTCATTREIAQQDTRTPIATEKLLTDISNTVESVDQQAPAAPPSTSSGTAFARHRPGPAADHRHRQLVHQRRPTPTSTSPPP